MQKELLVFFAILGIALAAVAIGKADPKPEKFKDVPGCYLEVLDDVIPPGESRPSPKSCMEYRCGGEWVSYVSCGAVIAAPNIKLVENKSLPYPGCCKKVA